MAAEFTIRWPVGGSYTQTFNPSIDPIEDESDIIRNPGVNAERMSVPSVQRSYRQSDPFYEYVYVFEFEKADVDLLHAFEDVVGGADFEFRDGEFAADTYGVGCFTEETLRQRTYRRLAVGRRKVTIKILVKTLPS